MKQQNVLWIAVGVAMATTSVAWGVPRMFSSGSAVSAAEMNENFAAIESELDRLRNQMETRVCGVTMTAFTGQMQGYAGAAANCRSAPGCGSGARMCLSWEVAAHLARGQPLPAIGATNAAWVSTAVYELSNGGRTNDCDGWTQGASDYGQTVAANGSFNNGGCVSRLPIMCCH